MINLKMSLLLTCLSRICSVYDIFMCFSEYYFVSPLMANADLLGALKRDEAQKDAIDLTVPVRVRIMYQIASAVAFLHKEVEDYRLASIAYIS